MKLAGFPFHPAVIPSPPPCECRISSSHPPLQISTLSLLLPASKLMRSLSLPGEKDDEVVGEVAMRNMAVLARRMDAVRLRFSGFRFPGTPAAAAAMSETTESIGLRWSAAATTAVAASATGSEARSPGLGSWSCPPPIASPPSIPDDDSGRRIGLRINRDLSFTIIYGRLISQVEGAPRSLLSRSLSRFFFLFSEEPTDLRLNLFSLLFNCVQRSSG